MVGGAADRPQAVDVATGQLWIDGVVERPLTQGHGFPVRLVAPDHRGVEWVKWVTEIRINATSKIWQSPLPLQ